MHAVVLAFFLVITSGLGPVSADIRASHLVEEPLDGDTLRLAGGQEVRLAGIEAPALTHRLGAPARQVLAALVTGQRVAITPAQPEPDRWNRWVVQVHRSDDRLWLQSAMVAAGWARVRPFGDSAAAAERLLPIEAEARAARRGLWADAEFRVRNADDPLWDQRDSFQIVEGRVLSANRVGRGTVYLNFGQNWRQDFTVALTPRLVRTLEQAGHNPLTLANRQVRARGWLEWRGGPMLELSIVQQLEILP